jgi:hypothetical protein
VAILNSSVGYSDGLDGPGSIPGRRKILLFSPTARSALGPTQPPVQWVPAALSPGVKRPGREATTHLHLMPKSRMCGGIPPLPHKL